MTQHTSTSTSDVADVIRRRRAQLGVSQIEAARMAGISRRTWGQIELGHRVGNKATLYKIAEALQLPPESLWSAVITEDAADDLGEIRRELIAMVKQLTTRDELQDVRLIITRRRLVALQEQLAELERAATDGESA
jgi:transcriptional regulator with XRE-family HTH domain